MRRLDKLKLVTFKPTQNSDERLGALIDRDKVIVDLASAYASQKGLTQNEASREIPPDLVKLLTFGEGHMKKAVNLVSAIDQEIRKGTFKFREGEETHAYRLEEIKLCAPITHPPKNIICLAVNYPDHAREGGSIPPENPRLFTKPWTAIVGPEDAVIYPKITKKLDYEGELAVVMGKRCRKIQQNEAYDYIAGYTIMNDISERDIQFGDKQYFRGKSFDTFAPMGPCLVLKDQIPDPHKLRIQTRVNSEIRQDSLAGTMFFKIPSIVSFTSAFLTLEPGDVISTGTPGGVGIYAKPTPKLLKPGDVVEVEIEPIGILRNYIKEEKE
jgi:2-keto-4-pentenoate hydratase/2-oxohepta-3-ene-1,7-dioic acid hydratase in catechol pathway